MRKLSDDWSWVPSRSWEWSEDASTCGVHTGEHKLVWWRRPDGAGGYFGEVAREQSFEDFLQNGAPVFVPDKVSAELHQILCR